MSIAPLSASVSVPGQGSTGALTPNAGAARSTDAKNKKLREACEGFESIFIQKMWEQMQNTVPKEGLMHSREERTWQSMYDQELSKKMTSAGGIGLADMMYEQLSRNLQHVSSTTAGGNAPDTRAFSAQAAPLLPPAPPAATAASPAGRQGHSAQADPVYEASPMPERGEVNQAQVNAVLQSLRADQAARPAPVEEVSTLDTMNAAEALLRQNPAAQASPNAPATSLSAAQAQPHIQGQQAAQPVVTRSTFSSNIPNSPQMEAQRMAPMQAAGAPAAALSALSGAAFQAPPLTAANNGMPAMNGGQPATGTAAGAPMGTPAGAVTGTVTGPAANAARTDAGISTAAAPLNSAQANAALSPASQPRVTRTRHTTNIPSRVTGHTGRTSASAPTQRPNPTRTTTAQAGAGDIRTLNLQGESMNLTSSAAQNLLARQILEQQQAKSAPAAPSPALQAGMHSAGLEGTSPEALQAAMAGQLSRMNAGGGQMPLGAAAPANTQTTMESQPSQEQSDALNMQITALRHDNMLQQVQGMSPVAGAGIPPLRSR